MNNKNINLVNCTSVSVKTNIAPSFNGKISKYEIKILIREILSDIQPASCRQKDIIDKLKDKGITSCLSSISRYLAELKDDGLINKNNLTFRWEIVK